MTHFSFRTTFDSSHAISSGRPTETFRTSHFADVQTNVLHVSDISAATTESLGKHWTLYTFFFFAQSLISFMRGKEIQK